LVEPEVVRVILDGPMHGIAGQSVFGRERFQTTVLETAQAADRGCPQGSVGVQLELVFYLDRFLFKVLQHF